MELRRLDLDSLAFAFAVSALGAATLAFVAVRNGAAVVMCSLCVAGLIAGRLAGIRGVALLAVALGLIAVLWLVWVDSPAGPRTTSGLAHVAGGALVGWAIARTLLARRAPAWGLLAILAVATLTVGWEVGELFGDRALGTELDQNKRDAAVDIFFGCLGGTAGIAFARLLAPRQRAG